MAEKNMIKNTRNLKKVRYLFVIPFLLFSFTSANAEGVALGIGVSGVNADGTSFTSGALSVSGKLNSNFGWSAELSGGGSDEGVDLDVAAAMKLRVGKDLGNTFIYGTVGYAHYQFSGGGLTIDGGGTVVGVGVDFFSESNWGLGLEYNRGFGDLEEGNLINALLKYRF